MIWIPSSVPSTCSTHEVEMRCSPSSDVKSVASATQLNVFGVSKANSRILNLLFNFFMRDCSSCLLVFSQLKGKQFFDVFLSFPRPKVDLPSRPHPGFALSLILSFLCCLCSDAEEEGELEPAKELIQPIAEKLMVKYKAKEEETPLLFFVAGEVRRGSQGR